MGIYANVEVTVEEAVSDQGAGLNLETGELYAVLREYLEIRLSREGDRVILRSSSPRAKIWWKKEE